MKSRFLLAPFLLAALLSCSGNPGTSLEPGLEKPEEVILAHLNGEPLLESEFEDFIQFAQGELTGDPSTPPLLQLFRDFMIRRLLLQKAQSEGLAVSNEEVSAYLETRILDGDLISEEVLEHTKSLLLIQRYLNRLIAPRVEVTLAELQTYYEANHEQFKVDDQAHVLEILTDDLETAENLRSEIIEDDMRTFKELAQRHSNGVTAYQGGDLGTFERGELPEEFEKIIFTLSPGEISQPFRSDYGYHLFLLEEWVPRHDQKFYEVKEEIFEKLVTRKEREELNKLFNNLLENASIEIYEPTFQLNTEESAINENLPD